MMNEEKMKKAIVTAVFAGVMTVAVLSPLVSSGDVAHLAYPVSAHSEQRETVTNMVFGIGQSEARSIVWGVAARFSGIDPMLESNHRKFGITIQFVFDDGTDAWFEPKQAFAAKNPGWQHISGIYQPRRPVKKASVCCRLATKGEAWFDGVTLFEVPDGPVHEKCRMDEKDGVWTLENGFLSVSLVPQEGATVTRLVDKKTGADYVADNRKGRLLRDRLRKGGECDECPWRAEVKRATDDEVALELKTTGPKGYPFLEVTRRLVLRRDASALDVAYAWFNQPASMGDLIIEPWVKNGLSPYGGCRPLLMYPTAGGVCRVSPDGDAVGRGESIGGWYAVRADDRRTMAFSFDWSNAAETRFACESGDRFAGDVILKPLKIAAGGTLSQECGFFLLQGLKNPDWIGNGIAAEIERKDGRAAVRIDGSVRNVFNVDLVGVYADGHKEHVRECVLVSPDATVSPKGTLPAAGLKTVAARLYSAGALVFEADHAFTKDYVYQPKQARAKPVEVKPFVLELKRDLVTPHAEFARPWAGGKPRVLFLTSFYQARELVELMERADIDVRTVRLAPNESMTDWAMIERFGNYKYFDMNASLKKELERRFDAIVVSGNLMDPVDKENKALIEKQLSAGTGLVRIGTKNPPLENVKAASDWIEGNVSPELLINCAGRVRAADMDTHREVMLDYEGRMGLTPFIGYQWSEKPSFRYQDYSLGLVARAVFWAAKMDVKVPADAKVEEQVVDAGPGLQIRHTFWKDARGVWDWKAEAVHLAKTAKIVKFAVDRDVFRIGDKVEGVLESDGGTARVGLYDGFGRLLAVTASAGRFALAIPEARTGLLTVKASVFKGGKLADVAEKDVFCRIPYHRLEYPLCLAEDWTSYGGEKEYLLKYRAEIYHQLGVNFLRYWESTRTDAYAHMLRHGFEFDFSIYDARLTADWREFCRKYLDPYTKDRDKKHLVREKCLHDPEYRKQLDAKTQANVKRIAKFSPLTCDCGDENTLTSFALAYDFCFSEHTLKAFREWLKQEYGALDRLNAKWRTAYASWDDVKPDTTIEARERAGKTGVKSYAAWADHRRFMELTFCETIERVGKILDRELPGVPLDMSGTQVPNGWTGMDMWLISKSVKEPAAYFVGLLGDYIRSFGRPYIKPWTGYGVQAQFLEVWPWMVGFKFLDAGIYFWTCFNFLLPDYSPSLSAVQYGKVGDEMKTGAARLLRSLEYHHEVLIHYSYGSIHAAGIENRQPAFDQCSLQWTRELMSRGIPYRFVSYEEIENGELDRTTAKTLILPQSAAISDKEVEAISRFARRGGRVVGDDFTGRMDEHCGLREQPVLGDIICRELPLGPLETDGVSAYPLFGRDGAEGRYWGFAREHQSGDGLAKRTIRLESPAYVYDLRAKKTLGKVDEFSVSLASGQAKFFAALPYGVGDVSVKANDSAPGEEVKIVVKVGVPTGAKACHPVMVEVYEPSGKKNRLYSGVCDAKGGMGVHAFRMALNDPQGTWRMVATDYITGKTASVSFKVGTRGSKEQE